MGPNVQF